MTALAEIKAGDIVDLCTYGWNPTRNPVQVTRVTDTQIVIGNNRYSKRYGRQVGGHGGERIEIHDEAKCQRFEQDRRLRNIRSFIQRFDCGALSDGQAVEVFMLMKRFQKENEAREALK